MEKDEVQAPAPHRQNSLCPLSGPYYNIYSSHLSQWRKQRSEGELGTGKRDNDEVVLLEAQLEAAHRTIEGLRSKLGKAELIIDVQKKISSAFGIGIQESESP